MIAGSDLIPIAAAGGATPSDDGEVIAFSVVQNDATTNRRFQFVCAVQTATDLVATLLQALRKAGANRQAKGNTSAPSLAPPSILIADDPASKTIRMNVEAPPGAPLDVTLSFAQAVQLSENLAAAVSRLR